ncbi:hypothetical protein, partial [Nocardia cyriacigeorgica]|uniref:hypothetical protein n=1 Tax=Nocardia cyriacigeorgica TaxID=135487 RepID=UPI002458D4A1
MEPRPQPAAAVDSFYGVARDPRTGREPSAHAVLTWTTRAPDAGGRLLPVPTDGEVRLIPADSPRAPVQAW